MASLLSVSLFAPSIIHLDNDKYIFLKNDIIFRSPKIEGIYLNIKFNQRDKLLIFLCQKTPFVIHWLNYLGVLIRYSSWKYQTPLNSWRFTSDWLNFLSMLIHNTSEYICFNIPRLDNWQIPLFKVCNCIEWDNLKKPIPNTSHY